MIGGPYYIPSPVSYEQWVPPKPVGYWILYAQASPNTSFAMYHKPSWVQRWFTNKLLGWTWRDA